nr:PREDICTED: solute carrier family 23 member 3 isoform X3 [Anolis carolinensis]|eukprot:XP_008108305.1 PREDICTED: solute carrier family 23 member 3 isoform X3 [Anolis carolinensis]
MNKARRSSQSILTQAYADPRLPSWPLSCFLAVQHLLVQVSFLCIIYFLFIANLPREKINGIPNWDELLARNLFACGIATALQCGLGSRLPLIQAPSFEFLIPAMALIQHVVPSLQSKGNSTEATEICTGPHCENSRNWHWLFCEISGAVLVSALVQIVLGLSGACGWIVNRCGPMVLAPSLSVIGLSAYRPAALLCSENWGVALLLVLLSILLSQHLASCQLPLCQRIPARGFSVRLRVPALHIFSIMLPFLGIWLVYGILRPVPTSWEMLHLSAHYLTFTNSTLLSPWIKIPYPGEQGWPTLSIRAAGVGVAMGIIASVNSVGCYVLCSKVLRLPVPPQHACNRGLCAEGLGSLLSAVLGSVSGTGSSMSNTCAAHLTKTTSSRSVWLAALACVLLGLSPRLMGLLTTIPLGIHGTLQERGLLNHVSSCKPEAGENFLPQSQKGFAQGYELPLVLQRCLSHSWCKGFPLCFLCPLEKEKGEVVNSYPLDELYCSKGETTDFLLRQETVKLESELHLELEQESGMMQDSSENHRCGNPATHEMSPLC